jgi:D-alanyl-D-alanine carboxypeptidase/D-alanyl-D-alanine-endopeptidase (penicillin-binding protein 4)
MNTELMYRRILFFFLLGLFVNTVLAAQTSLQASIDEWVADDYFTHTSVGIAVADATTGELLAGHDSERSLIPASNLKLLTTASALKILGPDYQFETQLAYDGYVDAEGVLSGNLYLVGSGDPSLGSPDMEGTPGLEALLERFSLAVQQAGIRQITGRVITDERAFSSAANGSHWQWLDMGNYYGCGAFGLNLHDNLYYLRFQQRSQLGAVPPVANISPDIPGLQFANEVKSAGRGSGDNAYIYGAPYTYQRHLRGTIPVGSGSFTIKGAIPDPPLFAAQQLQRTLESVGILCLRPPATARSLGDALPALGEPKVLYTHKSPRLQHIADRTNMESVNLYAEALLRAIGRKANGEGSAEAGLEAIKTYWEGRGLDLGGVLLYDGSGMAPRNVLPPAFFCDLLSAMYQDEDIQQVFWESLPLAGRSGSLKNSLKGTAAEGKLRAKSGSLEQVRAYSGYVTSRSGRVLAFSVLLNNYQGSGGDARRKLLAIMARLAE